MQTLTLFLLATGLFLSLPAIQSVVVAQDPPAMIVGLRFKESQVLPDQQIILEEIVPIKLKLQVKGINHDVLRIGHFDERVGTLVNRASSDFVTLNPDRIFDGLPGSIGFSHNIPLKRFDENSESVQFSFRSKRIGIFLLTTTWYLGGSNQPISSNPVILIVSPPIGSKAKEMAEKQWLRVD